MLAKTNLLSRSTQSSQSCSLVSIQHWCPFCRSYVSCCFTLSHKLSSLPSICWSPPFSLHLQHISQLPQDFVMSPYISPESTSELLSILADKICTIVHFFPHNLLFWSSLSLHCCKFEGDESVSCTDFSRNEIINWSSDLSSYLWFPHLKFHFIQAPCVPIFQCRTLLLLFSSPEPKLSTKHPFGKKILNC